MSLLLFACDEPDTFGCEDSSPIMVLDIAAGQEFGPVVTEYEEGLAVVSPTARDFTPVLVDPCSQTVEPLPGLLAHAVDGAIVACDAGGFARVVDEDGQVERTLGRGCSPVRTEWGWVGWDGVDSALWLAPDEGPLRTLVDDLAWYPWHFFPPIVYGHTVFVESAAEGMIRVDLATGQRRSVLDSVLFWYPFVEHGVAVFTEPLREDIPQQDQPTVLGVLNLETDEVSRREVYARIRHVHWPFAAIETGEGEFSMLHLERGGTTPLLRDTAPSRFAMTAQQTLVTVHLGASISVDEYSIDDQGVLTPFRTLASFDPSGSATRSGLTEVGVEILVPTDASGGRLVFVPFDGSQVVELAPRVETFWNRLSDGRVLSGGPQLELWEPDEDESTVLSEKGVIVAVTESDEVYWYEPEVGGLWRQQL